MIHNINIFRRATLALAAALLTTATAWATTTSTITVGGTGYTLFTGFTATDGTAVNNVFVYGNAVDGSTSTSWLPQSSDTFVEFNTDDPIVPKGYIFNTYMEGYYFPHAWVLKAKANTTDDWTTLSSYSGQSLSSGQEFQYACSNDGNTAYKYFRFEASNTNNNIWLTEIRLYGYEALTYTHLTVTPATCTATGIKVDCYRRSDGKYFTDATGTTELAESDVIESMKAHTGIHHAADEDHIEYWQCSMCSKYFSDEACTTEITEAQTLVVRYLDGNGTLTTLNENATAVTSTTTSWTDGWYMLYDDVTIADRISVSGTVNLILTNGKTLTASKGITVGSSATLNLYAQSDDEATMGVLVATAENNSNNAAIGGVNNMNFGTIVINGGKITATTNSNSGAAIGGGYGSTGGNITINGGIVSATAGDYSNSAGIGGGNNGYVASVTLNGGIITSTGDTEYGGAGIGTGSYAGSGTMTVTIGSSVKKLVAARGKNSECIGKGPSASTTVNVVFKNGNTTVEGDAKDAVFYDSGEGSVRQVRAKALNHAVTMSDDLKANITATPEYALTGETVTLTLGTAVDATTLSVNGGAVATTDAGNRQYTFTMPDEDVTVTATLLQTYAVSLPANMEVVSATNAADADGKYITGTTVTFMASFPYAASNVSDGTNTLEPDANGVYTVTIGTADITVTATVERSTTIDLSDATVDFTAIEGDVLTGSTSHTVTIADGAGITLSGATISGGIVCEGTATITLDGTNIVNVNDASLAYSKAGIQIGSSLTTLTIRGDGSLTATGGSAAAGIGLGRTWDASVTAGAIVIEGGTITANGGNGIGTGTVGNSKTASIDGISIKGGTVSASLGKGNIYNGSTATVGYIKIYDTIDMVDASKITETVTYMHGETDVTADKTDYFTIGENGDRRIIVPKDDTDYTITIADGIEHGTLTVAETAKYLETVTVTATPAFGYHFVRLVVKDADNNDVASTNNTFLMPKGGATVSAVFEQGVHGTTEFAWGYFGPDGFVNEATIYDGVTTVNIQQQSYEILKYEDEYNYQEFLLDNDTYAADIPYDGGTGEFVSTNGTNFNFPDDGQTGYYDITMTDAGNGKWSVSIQKTAGQMDVVPDQTYTGSAITPEPLVIAGSLSLTKGTDYTYSYTNNTDAGTATVRATFQGDYESLGYVEKEFTIAPWSGTGSEGDPYVIEYASQLLLLAHRVNGTNGETANTYEGMYFKLGADITFDHDADEGDYYDENYEAIGTYIDGTYRYFNGDFDGDGHTVSGIRIRKTTGSSDYQGLFGLIDSGADIHDVHLTDARIKGYNSVGGIVGYNYGTVSGCSVTDSYITATDNWNYGTICGWNGGTLTNNYYHGCTVNGTAVTSGMGCQGADIADINGALPAYRLALGANITTPPGTFADQTEWLTTPPVDPRLAPENGFTLAGNHYFASGYKFTPGSTLASGAAQGYTPRATLGGQLLDPYTPTGDADPLAGTAIAQFTVTAECDGKTLASTQAIYSTRQPVTVAYINADGSAGEASAIALDGTETSLAAGWYFVGKNISYDATLTLGGDVHLILADGKTMNVRTTKDNDGISAEGHSLHIYGQTEGTGALNAQTKFKTAVVIRITNGTLGIHGGNVNANAESTVSTRSAISVERTTAGDALVIDRGTLTANSKGSCGINIYGGDVRINGGQVTATGAQLGIDISDYEDDESLSIPGILTLSGGTLTASSFDTWSGESCAGTLAIAPGLTYTDGTSLYDSTTETATLAALAGKTLQPCLALADAADNTAAITDHAGQTLAVALSGRTLYKDGSWNTLCLPFAVDLTASGPLSGDNVQAMTLNTTTSTFADGTLTLNFDAAETIPAGTPFIIKWDKPSNYVAYTGQNAATCSDLVSPVFMGVAIDAEKHDATVTNVLTFTGTYAPVPIPATGDNTKLYLGNANKLYYPNAAMTIGCQRAYFQLLGDLTAGDPTSPQSSHVRAFNLNFGNDETTGIISVHDSGFTVNGSDAWYTLDGRRLDGVPTAKGLYIHGGRKVIVK